MKYFLSTYFCYNYSMHVYSKDTDTVIFREHDTQVYENKNANPEEEMVFCYQNCSDLL